jgi:mannose-6-phosphate isomerase-like protein (cupin superfamily)
MFHFCMVKRPSRRVFLQTVPLAAAAALPLTDKALFAEAPAQIAAPVPFQLFSAEKIAESTAKLHTTPGNDNLFQPASLPFTIVLTTEDKKAAKEFEWHEGRDHIVQILDGETLYDVGGTPQNGRNTKPSEWLAPTSEGATKLHLKKGDMLVIPRGTPHKRTTETSVTFYLISTTGNPPA